MIEFLVLPSLFSYSFALIMANVTGLQESFWVRLLAVVSLGISGISFVQSQNKGQNKQVIRQRNMLLIWILGLSGMLLTGVLYGEFSSLLRSTIYSYGTRVLSGILLGVALIKKNSLERIVKWIEPFVLFCTVVIIGAVYRNRGLSMYELEINRQTLAYAAAYNITLLLYLNTNFSLVSQLRVFEGGIWKWINWVMIGVNVCAIFAGGGRGALVLVFGVVAYYFIINLNSNNINTIGKLVLVIVIAFICLRYITASVNISSGVESINNLFQNGFMADDSATERIELYRKSFSVAKKNWFVGHGVGAVVYEVGYYSHNLFTDILVDIGLIGVILFLIVCMQMIFRAFRWRKNKDIQLIFTLFLDGFVMLLFSGSILGDTLIWFGITALYMYIPHVQTKGACLDECSE